jgi:hypothetical protein
MIAMPHDLNRNMSAAEFEHALDQLGWSNRRLAARELGISDRQVRRIIAGVYPASPPIRQLLRLLLEHQDQKRKQKHG